MIILKSLRFVALSSIAVAGKTSNLRKHGGSASRGLADCADNLSPWKLELTVDDYPWETRWTIKDLSGNKIAFGPSDDMNYEKRESYVDAGCLPEGDYVFTIKDRSGDGMCCSYGEGNFEFKVDDSTLVESDKNSFKKLEFPFTVRNQIVVDDLESNSDLSSETSEELNPATEAPSTSRPIKDPSRQPTQRPSPSPSVTPSTASPSESPSSAPVTSRPTTTKPTPSPSSNPTHAPSSSPTASPSKKPTGMPLTPWPTYEPSESPTEPPSMMPTASPSKIPTDDPSFSPTATPSHFPSVSPVTLNPTISPSMNALNVPEKTDSSMPSIIQSEFPSSTLSETSISTLSEVPSVATTEEPIVTAIPSLYPSTPPSATRLVVQFTPFLLYLTTNETKIDLDELDSILTHHLLEEMLTNLPKSTEVGKVELLLTDITNNERSLKMQEQNNITETALNETNVELDIPTTATHEISISGDAYFAGPALPTTDQLDDLNSAAFEGEAGSEFISDLLSSDDPGLQSTVGVSVPIDDSHIELYEDYLNKGADSPPAENAFNLLYIIGALFVVGLLLVAAFVHRMKQSQRNRATNVDDFIEEPCDGDEEDDDLPTFISITPAEQCEQCDGENDCNPVVQDCAEGCGVSYCFVENIHEAPSQASTEVASNQTFSNDTTQRTLSTKEGELVTLETYDASGSSNNRPFQPTSLYQIHEHEEDTNHTNTGLFCGFNNAAGLATQKGDDKSRFGMESQWGLKPTNSEDTSVVQQTRTCSTACN